MTTGRPDPSMQAMLDCLADWKLELSKTTAHNYGYNLRHLDAWLRGQGSTLLDATTAELREYIAQRVAETGESGATAHANWRTMRAFYRWAVREDVLDGDPSKRIKGPRVTTMHQHVATEREFFALMEACHETGARKPIGHRDAAMLALLFNGLRRNELTELRIEGVDVNERVLVIPMTKGGRFRKVGLDDESARALRRVLRDRQETEGWLFVGTKGRLTANGIDQALRKRRERAGLRQVVLHSLRRGLAVEWLRSGKSQVGLMAHCGWRDSRMPSHYAGLLAEDLAIAERHDMERPALRAV